MQKKKLSLIFNQDNRLDSWVLEEANLAKVDLYSWLALIFLLSLGSWFKGL